MKKQLLAVFIVFIGAMILISAWPSIVESRKPVNMFIAKAKAEGSVPIIQIVASKEDGERAQQEVTKFNAMGGIKFSVGIFNAEDNMDTVVHYSMQIPGYIIFDADGKMSIQETGVVTASGLAQKSGNIHTH